MIFKCIVWFLASSAAQFEKIARWFAALFVQKINLSSGLPRYTRLEPSLRDTALAIKAFFTAVVQ